MHIHESKHFSKTISADTSLSLSQCQEIYHEDPSLLELREFIVRYTIPSHSESTEDTPLRPRPAQLSLSTNGQSIPVVSLCTIANSLLEENRYEDGIRFLSTLGAPSLAQNASLVDNLLRAFRPTSTIEGELKQRSSYLIQASTAGKLPADYSALWTIDDERREGIVQSQRSVLGYLASVKTQFMRPWFDRRFEAMADEFWDYVGELMAPPSSAPSSGGGGNTGRLEHEMYRGRVMLVGLLLEQMCADLAAHAADAWQSVFMRIVSEGFSSSGCVSYPKRLMSRISECFQIVSHGRCLQEEKKVVRLLFDMLSATTILETVARNNCVQEIAKWALDMTPHNMCALVDLMAADTLAVDVLSYLLLSWYRFIDPVAQEEGHRSGARRMLAKMQPGVERTAQFLMTALPPAKSDCTVHWLFLVCVLSLLVQRTVGAYVRRMCRANGETATDRSSHFVALLVNGRAGDVVDVLRKACQELEERVKLLVDGEEAVETLESPKGARGRRRSRAARDGEEEEDVAETRAKIRDELDFLTGFLQSL